MTPLVWANLPLGLLFILAIVGIPMWMTFKRPSTTPDHSQAREYLRFKESLAASVAASAGSVPDSPAPPRPRTEAGRAAVPGRRHAVPVAQRAHRAESARRAHSSSS